MGWKKHLAKRYVPSSMKWEAVLKGVGKLYRAVYDEMEKNGGKAVPTKTLADASYKLGLDFGRDLKEMLHLGTSLDDVATAMDVEHQIFGMKTTVVEKSEKRVVYHCHQCAWQKYLFPKLCVAIGQAEKGIAQAFDPNAKYHILQTRTMGKEYCIFTVEV
jgi:predicted hydrocarbon binding protein